MKKNIITILIGLTIAAAAEIVLRVLMSQNDNYLLFSILSFLDILIIIGLTIVVNVLITRYFSNKTVAETTTDSKTKDNAANTKDTTNTMPPSYPYIQETYTPIIREPNSTPLYEYESNNSTISINDLAYKPKIEPLGKEDIVLINAIIKNTLNNLSHKYSISALCIDLGNERTSLYRQVKGIYNCTPIDLIYSIKMAYAAKLLQETDITIRDIMFKIGMSDTVVTFENSFRKFYKSSPFQYRAENRKTDNESKKGN